MKHKLLRNTHPVLFLLFCILSVSGISGISVQAKATVDQGIYEIASAADDAFVLDVHSSSHTPQLFTTLNVNQQKFYFERLPGDVYRILALHTGEALTSADDSIQTADSDDASAVTSGIGSVPLITAALPEAGTHAVLKTQSWTLQDAGDGAFYIRCRTGRFLTLDGASPYNNASVCLRNFTGKSNQKWKLNETLISAVTTADTDCFNPYAEHGKFHRTRITLAFGPKKEVLTASVTAEWMVENAERAYIPDSDQITAYLTEMAEKYDTQGVPRKFTTTGGSEITLFKGDYGWKLDVDATTALLIQALENGENQTIDVVWSHKGASFAKGDDIGSSYVEIDLTEQKVWLYKDGVQLLETDMVSGTKNTDRQTPGGVYSIFYMQSPAVLKGADYASNVTYWMPYNGNIGLHDATWRDEFGGDVYLTDGSHGCVNLPLEAAKLIYETVSIGYPVVSYN